MNCELFLRRLKKDVLSILGYVVKALVHHSYSLTVELWHEGLGLKQNIGNYLYNIFCI